MANKRNQNLIQWVRRLHGLVEKDDLGKQRQSQNYIGSLLSNSKDVIYTPAEVDGMAAEWIRPNRPYMKEHVILYCHGGGYSTGSPLYARTITGKLADSTSMDVFCFDYRLAPEHPYPAALNDAMKAWNHLMLMGYGARDVIIAGDSAGGNLALALTLKLKEQGRFLPRGLMLMSPWTDLTSSGKSFVSKAEADPILDKAYVEKIVSAYAEGMDLKNPLISPLFADFKGFPPTYIQVGSNEILLSDSKRLYQRMLQDDVAVHLEIFKGMWHVFQMTPFRTANEAMDKNAEFVFEICR